MISDGLFYDSDALSFFIQSSRTLHTHLTMPAHSFSRLCKDLLWGYSFALLFATIFSAAAYFDVDQHLLDLGSHFRVQYLFLALLGMLIFAERRQWLTFSLACVCLALNVWAIYPFYSSGPSLELEGKAQLKLLLANVNTANREFDEFKAFVNTEAPDVLAILELSEEWGRRLPELSARFPYQKQRPSVDNFGIALLSRFALSDVRLRPLAAGEPPVVSAELDIDGEKLLLLAAHTLPPVSSEAYRLRNSQMQSISEFIREKSLPTLFLADLNMTPWSPTFRSFLKGTQLKDTRLGFGLNVSWPSGKPLLYIPIDHCLVSESIEAVEVETLPLTGSDHYALRCAVPL